MSVPESDLVPQPQAIATKPPFPGILGAIGLSVLLVAVMFAVNIALVVVLVLAGFGPDALMSFAMQSAGVVNVVCFLAVVTLGVVLAKAPARDFFPLSRFPWLTLVAMAMVIEGLVILVSELDNVFQSFFPMPEWLLAMITGVIHGGWTSFVTLIIVAPVTEEVFFRGLILRGLQKRYSARTAIIWSSILFSVIHINPYQMGPAFVVGIFLGWLMVRTQSLWPCLLAHAAFNLHPLLLPVLAERCGLHVQGFTVPVEEMGQQFQPLWFDAVGLGLTVTGLLMLAVVTRESSTGSIAAPDREPELFEGGPSSNDGPYRSPLSH